MAADDLQQVNEKEFADLQSRCRVNIRKNSERQSQIVITIAMHSAY